MKTRRTYGGFTKVELVKVVDGDTLKVNLTTHPIIGREVGIRIYGIDTLELRSDNTNEKANAFEALKFLKEYLVGKKIVLKNIQRDKYFRILAEVYADGVDLAKVLIDKGYAKPYFGGTK